MLDLGTWSRVKANRTITPRTYRRKTGFPESQHDMNPVDNRNVTSTDSKFIIGSSNRNDYEASRAAIVAESRLVDGHSHTVAEHSQAAVTGDIDLIEHSDIIGSQGEFSPCQQCGAPCRSTATTESSRLQNDIQAITGRVPELLLQCEISSRNPAPSFVVRCEDDIRVISTPIDVHRLSVKLNEPDEHNSMSIADILLEALVAYRDCTTAALKLDKSSDETRDNAHAVTTTSNTTRREELITTLNIIQRCCDIVTPTRRRNRVKHPTSEKLTRCLPPSRIVDRK